MSEHTFNRIDELVAEIASLRERLAKAENDKDVVATWGEDQKRRRVYYHDIVYAGWKISGTGALAPSEIAAVLPALLSAAAERAKLAADVAALHEALTPSAETEAAYTGEFQFAIPDGRSGWEYSRVVDVPWTTIKEIMAAIAARAATDAARGGGK